VNLDFGHFAIYNKGVWVVLHKWYPGYSLKTSSDLKETYNENIIQIGAHSKESVWRYLPFKPELSYVEIEDSHIFDIEFTASRNITIDKKHKQVKVTDFGGSHSNFNISDSCSYGISMTDQLSIETGYHSYTRTSVQTHKRLELSGAVRSITFNLS
jgi:hypothetical protein